MPRRIGAKEVRSRLTGALRSTCEEFLAEVKHLPIDHWNESVFRFCLVRQLLARNSNIECWTEWNRVDLVLPASGGAVSVEMKFFTTLPTLDNEGKLLGWKGAPGRKNFAEYQDVVAKLRRARNEPWAMDCSGVSTCFLVLAYADRKRSKRAGTYGAYYDSIRTKTPVVSIRTFADHVAIGGENEFTCKLLEVKAK